MTNLRIVTGANRDEARSMIQSYSKLADQLGVTTKEVANSANECCNVLINFCSFNEKNFILPKLSLKIIVSSIIIAKGIFFSSEYISEAKAFLGFNSDKVYFDFFSCSYNFKGNVFRLCSQNPLVIFLNFLPALCISNKIMYTDRLINKGFVLSVSKF